MKRLPLLMLSVLLLFTSACAESLPSQAEVVSAEGQALDFDSDFSVLKPADGASTPIPVDPIDKPTPTPAPTPNYVYESYVNEDMGVSFSIPYTWLLNPVTDKSKAVQFVEPKSEMMDVGGYQTRLTVEKISRGLSQTAADARAELETMLETLGGTFTNFVPGNIASATVGKANGAYCYYKAEFTDGEQTYVMNGRITVVAQGNALYSIRLTAPRAWYSYYEYVFRRVRQTFKFL